MFKKKKRKSILEDIKPQSLANVMNEAYTTCAILPMYNFVQCSITGDFKFLIKSGKPVNLPEIWQDILDEYADLSKDSKREYLLQLAIQIQILQNKMIIVEALVHQLRRGRNDELIALLQNDLLMPYSYEDLDPDLDKTLLASKHDELMFEQAKREYDDIIANDKKHSPSLQFYEEQLVWLSKWAACRYSINDTSVAQYCALIKAFNLANKPKPNA